MEKKDGYFIVKDKILPEETYITFGFGHLVELAPPNTYNANVKINEKGFIDFVSFAK